MKDLKSLFESYQKPVSESGWESITNDSKVVKFNKRQHIKRIATYGIGGLLTAAAITTAVVLVSPQNENQPSTIVKTSEVGTTSPQKEAEAPTVSPQSAVTSYQIPAKTNTTDNIFTDNENTDLTNVVTSSIPEQTLPIAQNLITPSAPDIEKPIFLTPKASHKSSSIGTILSKTEIPQVSRPEQNADEMVAMPESNNINPITLKNAREDEIPESFWAPNAFTPNGNGTNDRFRVYVNSKDYMENSDSTRNIDLNTFELNVFARNGQLVFHTRNIEEEWDGTIQNSGARLEPGVYVYTVRFSINKKNKFKKGTVTILK